MNNCMHGPDCINFGNFEHCIGEKTIPIICKHYCDEDHPPIGGCESCVFSNHWNGKHQPPLCNLGHHILDCTEGMTGFQYSNNRLANIPTEKLIAELERREGIDTTVVERWKSHHIVCSKEKPRIKVIAVTLPPNPDEPRTYYCQLCSWLKKEKLITLDAWKCGICGLLSEDEQGDPIRGCRCTGNDYENTPSRSQSTKSSGDQMTGNMGLVIDDFDTGAYW